MKQITLTAEERAQVGSGASRRLRKSGRIPAVLYGPSGRRSITVQASDFRNLWKEAAGRATLIELTVTGSDPQWAILREIQRDPRTDRFIHVDLQEIERGKEMTIDIGVRLVGEAFGVRTEGGMIELQSHELEIRCRPRDLPEVIVVDVANLRVGESLHVRDLPKIEGVTFVDDPDQVVVACVGKAAEEEPEAAEAPAGEPAAAAAPEKKG